MFKTPQIEKYWDERARQNKLQLSATTSDIWLRELEVRKIITALRRIRKKQKILDVGCGDGYTMLSVAKSFPKNSFLGIDFAPAMIENARLFAKKMHMPLCPKLNFAVGDVDDLSLLEQKFDVVISCRCIINLPSIKTQQKALEEISRILKPRGYLIFIENFVEGHRNFNKLRKRIGLPEIPIPWHNRFLDERFIKEKANRYFVVVSRENITSTYYLITRIAYSKLCQLEKREPDYVHPLYKIAVDIDEPVGNYGPVVMYLLRKK